MTKSIFITGATGFVGSHLYENLLKEGFNTLGLARSEKKWQSFNLPGAPVLGDLSDSSLKSWVNNLPEDLTHFVHTAGVVHSFETQIFEKTNTQATITLFELLKERFPKLHFIFISSLAAAGPASSQPLKEEDPPRPVSAYGRSKLKAEEYISAHLAPEMKLTIIRPPMVIGPRDPAVLDVFKMVKGRVILNTGLKGPQKTYSIVCVFDLVTLITKVIKKSEELEKVTSYYPSFPRHYTFAEIINSMEKGLNVKTVGLPIPFPVVKALASLLNAAYKVKKHDMRLTPDKINELAPMAWTCDGAKSLQELDMVYDYDLDRTVEITIEDYQKRGWL
jgi:nucleoside-diphosphate-sugar epimerase